MNAYLPDPLSIKWGVRAAEFGHYHTLYFIPGQLPGKVTRQFEKCQSISYSSFTHVLTGVCILLTARFCKWGIRLRFCCGQYKSINSRQDRNSHLPLVSLLPLSLRMLSLLVMDLCGMPR